MIPNKPSQQKLAQILADIIGDRYGVRITVTVVPREETEKCGQHMTKLTAGSTATSA